MMMSWQRWWQRVGLAMLTTILCCGHSAADQPVANNEETSSETARVSVQVARERAKLMHDVYAATLEVMHQRYFHDARAIVPARALEDVFDEIENKSNIHARWISVNTKPMSLNHAPKSNFEKKAAAEIGAGKSHWELVEDGVYRRAAAIPLTGGCVSCHAGMLADASKSPRFAGLVISIPVEQ